MKESKEAMKLALEFVEYHSKYWNGEGQHPQEIATALREALAEQPTAWVTAGQHTVPLVTQPAHPYDDETEEPCPSCGKALQSAKGGGVVCSAKCGYWFCF